MKKFCLTFDIEEFDIAKGISEEEMYSVSAEGTKKIIKLLEGEGIKATFFVTASFALKYPKLINEIGREHEIGCHGYSHREEYEKIDDENAYKLIKKSKNELEKITGKEIIGFRAPRMKLINSQIIKKAGFKYDASLLPACIPGRYSDFFKPRKMHTKNGLVIIPTSVTPILKIPLIWYGFRNFGLLYAKSCTRISSINNSYASMYFHPWEFMDLEKYYMSKAIKKNTGEKMEDMLRNYIRWCRNRYSFATMKELLNLNL